MGKPVRVQVPPSAPNKKEGAVKTKMTRDGSPNTRTLPRVTYCVLEHDPGMTNPMVLQKRTKDLVFDSRRSVQCAMDYYNRKNDWTEGPRTFAVFSNGVPMGVFRIDLSWLPNFEVERVDGKTQIQDRVGR